MTPAVVWLPALPARMNACAMLCVHRGAHLLQVDSRPHGRWLAASGLMNLESRLGLNLQGHGTLLCFV